MASVPLQASPRPALSPWRPVGELPADRAEAAQQRRPTAAALLLSRSPHRAVRSGWFQGVQAPYGTFSRL